MTTRSVRLALRPAVADFFRFSVRSSFVRARALALAALVLGVALVAQMQAPARAQEVKPVLFFAAASLQTALNKIAADWQKQSGKAVTFSYAASSTLARQMESGAPADIFASADLEWMDWSEQRKLIKPQTRRVLLNNTLVLIAQKEDPIALKIAPGFALAAAIGDSKLATGEIRSVPVGRYAQAALTALGVWPDVSAKIASAESVRVALALVARGEAKLGIVYQTDANAEPKVRVVDTFPASSHPPIAYPFAVTSASTNPDAQAFLDHLSTPAAIAVFKGEGFLFGSGAP